MIKFIYFLVGYRIYTFKKEDLRALAQILINNRFGAEIKNRNVILPLYKTRKFEKIINSIIPYERSRRYGIFGAILENLNAYEKIAALVFLFLSWYVSSLFVWDIRVSGNEITDEKTVIEELSEIGFSVGSFWGNISLSETELLLLSGSDEISWVNINRKGSVAYVKVIDKYSYEEEVKSGYRNLVAMRDGVIEEITVKAGRAVVKVGDTVKKGDLLISGILADGTFTYAEGSVISRISEKISVDTPYVAREKVYKDESLDKIVINFFGRNINIFKKYGKMPKEYDIIEKEKRFTLFGRELPISFSVFCLREYAYSDYRRSESEIVNEAHTQLWARLTERLSKSTLLKIRCEGDFTDNGYTSRAELLISEDIAVPLPFIVEQKENK